MIEKREPVTDEMFCQRNINPASDFLTLQDLGKPEALVSLFMKQGNGLGLISGLDDSEIQRTLAAMARSFEEEDYPVVSLRVGDSDPLPGMTEVHSNDVTASGQMLMRLPSTWVIFLDSLDTKEKLMFALNASLVGCIVIAPVVASSAWGAVEKVLDVDDGANPYLVSAALLYVAHERVVRDPFSSEVYAISDTDIMVSDDLIRERISAYSS